MDGWRGGTDSGLSDGLKSLREESRVAHRGSSVAAQLFVSSGRGSGDVRAGTGVYELQLLSLKMPLLLF